MFGPLAGHLNLNHDAVIFVAMGNRKKSHGFWPRIAKTEPNALKVTYKLLAPESHNCQYAQPLGTIWLVSYDTCHINISHIMVLITHGDSWDMPRGHTDTSHKWSTHTR